MFKRVPLRVVLAILSAVVMTGATVPVSAATTDSGGSGIGNGYKISPVRTDLTINAGSSQTLTMYVQNISSVTENLQVLVNDFVARNDESGGPALLVNGQSAPQHGLMKYITVSNPTMTLQPNEQKSFAVTVNIPTGVAGGGYFGAVRVAPVGAVSGKNVNLSASVASLILVRVPGNITEQLSILSFESLSGSSPHTFFTNNKSLNAAVRFRNNGNVQEEPFGKIQLKKGGKVVATYEVNNTDPKGNVLPGSIRKFTVKLTGVGSFGKYTLQGNFGYGTAGQLVSANTSFYVVPLGLIVLVLLAIVVLLFLIFTLPRMIRGHDQRVLRRAGRR